MKILKLQAENFKRLKAVSDGTGSGIIIEDGMIKEV